MNNQRVSVESKVFRKVDRLYPDSQVAIDSAWKQGEGWVPFIDLFPKMGYLYLVTSLIGRLGELGYTKVCLEITRKNNLVIRSDYTIRELAA